ncbi:MAG TPA: class I SAM-dependent methyltransferase [Candidatus Stackebrandtia faecavium]|nr:class I SAM-dependent methyltransferase [Candidatus Stackebrandtia faecavium]
MNAHSHEPWPGENAAESWEKRYSESDRIWSGRPNQALTGTVQDLPVGRALDVGCGEGADVLWLARHGWRADGIDLSTTAIERAVEAADEHGTGSASFDVADVSTWVSTRQHSYDLVIAMFLHAHDGHQDRSALLRSAGEAVNSGGRLLVVSHAEPPPWSDHGWEAITPDSDRVLLGTTDCWETEVAEIAGRTVRDPDGAEATLRDSVLLLRRS